MHVPIGKLLWPYTKMSLKNYILMAAMLNGV